MPTSKSEVLQGTLDLLVLKTLDSMGPMHGFGIAMRIQQVSEDLLQLNQGTLYPALLRLEQRGWIASKWGVSENNRKAKYYSLTRAGRKQMEEEAESWGRMSAMINRVLRATRCTFSPTPPGRRPRRRTALAPGDGRRAEPGQGHER